MAAVAAAADAEAFSGFLWAVGLDDLTLQAGGRVDAGAVVDVGTLTFGQSREIYGGAFYNGSYYALINGEDLLRKVDFDAAGNITTQGNIDLPGNNSVYLGDIDFDSDGNLWISGNNTSGEPTAAMSRLWRFSTSDGTNFVAQGAINHDGLRFNGILVDSDDALYGYRVGTSQYGMIDKTTGTFTSLYTGAPFGSGGDLTSGFLMNVDPVPEPSGTLMVGLAGSLVILRRRRNS